MRKESKIRCLLIDPDKAEITNIAVSEKDFIKETMTLLECKSKCSVFRTGFDNKGLDILFNLDKNDYRKSVEPGSFVIKDWQGSVRGKAIVFGSGFTGVPVDREISVAEIEPLIKFV